MRILVLGVTGLIGSSIFYNLCLNKSLQVYGTSRNKNDDRKNVIPFDFQIGNSDLKSILKKNRPDYLINCIGITKHIEETRNPLISISLNSLLPFIISEACEVSNSKLIHISSECVFAGDKGFYSEKDHPDTPDLYGKSKALGEVINDKDLTIRTSTIGHEIDTKNGLLEWFLSQENSCKGFKRAIFSGLTTQELSKVIEKIILSKKNIYGLFNVGGDSISKFNLLEIIAKVYLKKITINPENNFVIDRSLDSSKFRNQIGYSPPTWEEMIDNMYKQNLEKKNV